MQYDSNHEYLCNLYISKIKQYNARIFNQFLKECGCTSFTYEQSAVLQTLWQHQSLTCHEIASLTGLAANTITALVNNLIKNGLVKRQSSKRDRRVVMISLTDRGVEAKQEYDLVVSKIIGIGFAGFSDTDYAQFQAYLEKLCLSYEQFFNSSSGE